MHSPSGHHDTTHVAAGAGLIGFEAEPVAFVIDFDEWIDRAFPTRRNRDKARLLMEAAVGNGRSGLRVFRAEGRLKFERRSFLVKAVLVSR